MELTLDVVEKMKQVEQDLAQRHGPFSVFALLEREDTLGRWDVVVAAPWLDTTRKGIYTVAQQITKLLSPEQSVQIARIVPLPPESDFVQLLREVRGDSPKDPGAPRPLGPCFLGDVLLRRGYVLSAGESSGIRESHEALAA